MPREHFIKKYMTEQRGQDGQKIAVYVLSCTPCQVYGKTFPTKSARDTAAKKHRLSRVVTE